MDDDKTVFAGDVLLRSSGDGATIVIEDGLVKDCRNFDTAVYLSLFGGNEDDLNARPEKTWWGNLIPGTRRTEWMHSEFGASVTGRAITSGNLKMAGDAAKRDLEWVKNEAGADEINARLHAVSQQRATLTVEIMKDSASMAGGSFETQWQEAVR